MEEPHEASIINRRERREQLLVDEVRFGDEQFRVRNGHAQASSDAYTFHVFPTVRICFSNASAVRLVSKTCTTVPSLKGSAIESNGFTGSPM